MELGLKNRKAFITGASMGIGEIVVRGLAAEGVHIALLARSEDKCRKIIQEITAEHSIDAHYVPVDFNKPDSIPKAVDQAAAALGGCDILVNCASAAPRGQLEDVLGEELDLHLQRKPGGYMRMLGHSLPLLKQSDQARVINIGGHRGREPGLVSVCGSVANAATAAHTKQQALVQGEFGITINMVEPGDVDNYRWQNMIEREMENKNIAKGEAEKNLLSRIPLRKVAQPQDVANAVIFLASQAAGDITGTRLTVDGGDTRSL